MGTQSKAGQAPLLRLTTHRAVWAVAWPMVVIGLLKNTYYLTDTWFIGKIGHEALAAAGGTAFAWWMIFIAGELAGSGTLALVARHEGAGEKQKIGATMVQGMWVGLGVAVALMAMWPLRGLYFDLLGFERGSAEMTLGMQYLGACLLGAIAYCTHAVTDGVFRGLGDTRTSLVLACLTFILNGALDPLLIWGLGPIPAFGIAGAAWATAIARGFGAVLGLWVLIRRGIVPRPQWPRLKIAQRLTAIGLPVSTRGIAFAAVYVLLGRIITSFGPEHMAALGVGHRLEGLGFMICVGFEVAAATLVGQHLGARNVKGALHAANVAARMCVALIVPMGVALFVLAEPVFRIFAEDPETIAAGVLYLRLQTPIFAFMALESVYEGGFSGSGRPLPSLWIVGIGTALRLPLAWGLTVAGLGIGGVWVAIALTTVLKGIVLWYWFQRQGWARPLDLDAPGLAQAPAPAELPDAPPRPTHPI